jgi:hypothetical protein
MAGMYRAVPAAVPAPIPGRLGGGGKGRPVWRLPLCCVQRTYGKVLLAVVHMDIVTLQLLPPELLVGAVNTSCLPFSRSPIPCPHTCRGPARPQTLSSDALWCAT